MNRGARCIVTALCVRGAQHVWLGCSFRLCNNGLRTPTMSDCSFALRGSRFLDDRPRPTRGRQDQCMGPDRNPFSRLPCGCKARGHCGLQVCMFGSASPCPWRVARRRHARVSFMVCRGQSAAAKTYDPDPKPFSHLPCGRKARGHCGLQVCMVGSASPRPLVRRAPATCAHILDDLPRTARGRQDIGPRL